MSRRSMATYQQALDATSHNISNSSNADYSRQQVKLSAENPEVMGGFVWGTGVKMDQVQRVRNTLIDSQIRSNNQKSAENSSKNVLLGQIEELFSEPSELGISSLMNDFFDSWHELSVTPNSLPLRYNVIRNAEKLSDKASSVYSNLDLIKSDIMNDMKTKVDNLNNNLKEIQSLNAQIFSFKTSGTNANDLMDQRDKIIDELSKSANINISYDNNNSAIISVGGVFAVDKSNITEFKMAEVNGSIQLVTKSGDTTAILNSGELYALSSTYSVEIPKYQQEINTFFSSFADKVNSFHSKGYSLGNPPQKGINFFENYSNGILKINQKIKDDPLNISISTDGTAGNGDISLQIAEISGQKILNGTTLNDYYSSLISDIGSKKLSAQQTSESTDLVLEQLQIQKSSYSGVSVDEEMTNVIKFQRSYEASAKMIKVADELLQTILGIVQ